MATYVFIYLPLLTDFGSPLQKLGQFRWKILQGQLHSGLRGCVLPPKLGFWDSRISFKKEIPYITLKWSPKNVNCEFLAHFVLYL